MFNARLRRSMREYDRPLGIVRNSDTGDNVARGELHDVQALDTSFPCCDPPDIPSPLETGEDHVH